VSAPVRVTINGRTVEVPAGTLITDAARTAPGASNTSSSA